MKMEEPRSRITTSQKTIDLMGQYEEIKEKLWDLLYWRQQRKQTLRIHTDKNLIKVQMRTLDEISPIDYELEIKKAKNIVLHNSDNYITKTEHWFSNKD